MNDEKRSYIRVSFVEDVELILPEEKKHVSHSDNLSVSGMYLIMEDPLPPGTEGLLNMVINDDDTKTDVSCHFKVVHNKPSTIGASGMGIEFLDLDEKGIIAILNIL